jgi:hypothetical protein
MDSFNKIENINFDEKIMKQVLLVKLQMYHLILCN